MFHLPEGSMYDALDQDIRVKLADLHQLRINFYKVQAEESSRRIQLLMYPTPEVAQALVKYTKTTVNPMRDELQEETIALMLKAVDVEGLKSMLPILLAAVSNHVNLPLLLDAAGLDLANIEDVIKLVREYFSQDDAD